MDAKMKSNPRKKPNKKWADYEVKLLLDYMVEQPEIEKPTAQIFYRKFLKKSGIDASWDLCRWKVKHLKNCYFKTKSMQRSAGDGQLERKSCRFYDELNIIFGTKCDKLSFEVCNTRIKSELDINNTPASNMANEQNDFTTNGKNEFIAGDQNEFIGFEGVDDFRSTPVLESDPLPAKDDCIERQSSSSISLPSISPPRSSCLPNSFHQKSKTARLKNVEAIPSNPLEQVYFMQRNTYLKLKIDFEKEKFEKEFALKERQFEEEIKERRENLELKKLEIEKKERLRILEIEKQERVERFEIEMRYKHGSQK